MRKKVSLYLLTFLFIENLVFTTSNPEKLNYDVGDKLWNMNFISINNEIKTLDSFKGKKVLLNFTATWCPDCQKEKEIMNPEYISKFKNSDKIEFIIMNGPFRTDTIETVTKYMKDHKYDLPTYYDHDRELIQEFGIKRIPTNILIDEEGKIEAIDIENGYKNLNYFK